MAGVLDVGYTGTVKVKIFNPTNSTVQINTGDAIAQLLVIPIMLVNPVAASSLAPTKRGTDGGINRLK